MKRSGRKSAAQTPAPKKERIYGSSKNPKGSAASKSSASNIKLSTQALDALKAKREKFKKENPSKDVSVNTLKAVMRRGMGAYSKSHRPTITGGAPNSRQAWGFARVNKFLEKKAGKPVKKAYVQDDDLLEKGGQVENGVQKFLKWQIEWNKSLVGKLNVFVSIPNELTPFEVYKDTIILDLFEKIDQDINAKPYLREMLAKADEYGVSIIIEPKPRYKYFEQNIEKRNKIDVPYLKEYYSNFGFKPLDDKYMIRKPQGFKDNNTNPDIRFKDGGKMEDKIALPDTYASYEPLKQILKNQGYELNKINMDIPVGKLAKGMSVSEVAAIHNMKAEDLKAELVMGVETEMEHTDVPDYARAIALDHLYEDPKYYTKLKKMEGIDKHYSDISKKFAEGGQIDPIFSFKTPTGEPSRLNYLQQVLVRTNGFKEFFGDWEEAAKSFLLDGKENFEIHYKNVSKVIDYVTLEPRVVFHGTRAEDEFFRFDVTKEKGVGRPYGYFAHNLEYSENFTKFSQRTTRETKPLLYKCFLNVRNPFYAITSEYWQKSKDAEGWKQVITGTISWDKYKTIEINDRTKIVADSVDSQIGDYLNKVYSEGKAPFWRLMASDIEKDFKYFIMAYGFDGIFYGEEIKNDYDPENPAEYTQAVTIFDSKQVKLADGRNLNFNPLIDDIRYEEGGEIHEENAHNLTYMNKKARLGMLIGGQEYAEGGTIITEHGSTNDGKKGGYFHGRSHADGGIKAINVDTGQLIEVEGEEVIITKGAVNDETKREFEGEMLTNREILSRINQSGGGVAFEEGGEIKASTCGCTGKKYKFGGELYEDYQIIRFLNDPSKLNSYITKNSRDFADSLVEKMK